MERYIVKGEAEAVGRAQEELGLVRVQVGERALEIDADIR